MPDLGLDGNLDAPFRVYVLRRGDVYDIPDPSRETILAQCQNACSVVLIIRQRLTETYQFK